MRGIGRLIDGLSNGDPTAITIGIFAVAGTLAVVAVTHIIRKKRAAEARDKA
jgi:hypothetical protein